MKRTTWALGSLLGAVGATVLILACSDDSPGNADAAVCDCPAAEPPLAGRITSVTRMGNVPSGIAGGASVDCPVGSIVLGGGCDLTIDDPAVQLIEARIARGGGQEGYVCQWSSTDATVANTGTAEAICLRTAP